MLLLGVDTSGKQGSIALATCGAEEGGSVREVVPLAGGAFSAQLVPEIAALLKKHGYTKADIDAFAVVTGPGSFTGLRVGLAAIKGLAEALQKPIVAISLLEALAYSHNSKAPNDGTVLAALDAGRGDIYLGDYEFDTEVPPNICQHTERLLTREQFVAELKSLHPKRKVSVVTPDAALADTLTGLLADALPKMMSAPIQPGAIGSGVPVELVPYPDSGAVVQLAWRRLRSGETVRPEQLEANYLRHSDAEIFAKPKPEPEVKPNPNPKQKVTRIPGLVATALLLLSVNLLAQHSSGGGSGSSGGSHSVSSIGFSSAPARSFPSSRSTPGSGSMAPSSNGHTPSTSPHHPDPGAPSHASPSSAPEKKGFLASLRHPFRKPVRPAEFVLPRRCKGASCAVCPPGESRGFGGCVLASTTCPSGRSWNGFGCGTQFWFYDCSSLRAELDSERLELADSSDPGASLRYQSLLNQYQNCLARYGTEPFGFYPLTSFPFDPYGFSYYGFPFGSNSYGLYGTLLPGTP